MAGVIGNINSLFYAKESQGETDRVGAEMTRAWCSSTHNCQLWSTRSHFLLSKIPNG